MTDLIQPTSRYVRCPVEIDDKGTICAAEIRNTPANRAEHLRVHDLADTVTRLADRMAQVSQSLRFLGDEIDGLRAEARTGTPSAADEPIGEWPDSDFDTDDEPEDEEIDAADTTDEADLNDITGPISLPALTAVDDEDLDARIARQTGGIA